MYPSIDNKVGLAACKEALYCREHTSPSTECLLETIKITLECNSSVFNKNHCRQNRGTAMCLHHACSYADLAMITIDRRILDVNKEIKQTDAAFERGRSTSKFLFKRPQDQVN